MWTPQQETGQAQTAAGSGIAADGVVVANSSQETSMSGPPPATPVNSRQNASASSSQHPTANPTPFSSAFPTAWAIGAVAQQAAADANLGPSRNSAMASMVQPPSDLLPQGLLATPQPTTPATQLLKVLQSRGVGGLSLGPEAANASYTPFSNAAPVGESPGTSAGNGAAGGGPGVSSGLVAQGPLDSLVLPSPSLLPGGVHSLPTPTSSTSHIPHPTGYGGNSSNNNNNNNRSSPSGGAAKDATADTASSKPRGGGGGAGGAAGGQAGYPPSGGGSGGRGGYGHGYNGSYGAGGQRGGSQGSGGYRNQHQPYAGNYQQPQQPYQAGGQAGAPGSPGMGYMAGGVYYPPRAGAGQAGAGGRGGGPAGGAGTPNSAREPREGSAGSGRQMRSTGGAPAAPGTTGAGSANNSSSGAAGGGKSGGQPYGQDASAAGAAGAPYGMHGGHPGMHPAPYAVYGMVPPGVVPVMPGHVVNSPRNLDPHGHMGPPGPHMMMAAGPHMHMHPGAPAGPHMAAMHAAYGHMGPGPHMGHMHHAHHAGGGGGGPMGAYHGHGMPVGAGGGGYPGGGHGYGGGGMHYGSGGGPPGQGGGRGMMGGGGGRGAGAAGWMAGAHGGPGRAGLHGPLARVGGGGSGAGDGAGGGAGGGSGRDSPLQGRGGRAGAGGARDKADKGRAVGELRGGKTGNSRAPAVVAACAAAVTALDEQLRALAAELTPGPEELAAHAAALAAVAELIKGRWPDVTVHLFGSAANGLCLAGANEVDVTVEVPGMGWDDHAAKSAFVTELGDLASGGATTAAAAAAAAQHAAKVAAAAAAAAASAGAEGEAAKAEGGADKAEAPAATQAENGGAEEAAAGAASNAEPGAAATAAADGDGGAPQPAVAGGSGGPAGGERVAPMEAVSALPKARTPVVKLTVPSTKTRVDITINNLLALANTALLGSYCELDGRLRQLALLVKHWAKTRGVNDAYKGSLSSYAYSLLCVWLLQTRQPPVLPVLQDPGRPHTFDTTVGPWRCSYTDDLSGLEGFGAANKETLAELLVAFFDHWAWRHDYNSAVVCVRTGGTVTKAAKEWTKRQGNERHLMCIEDPFELNHDLGRTIDKAAVQVLRREFERAARVFASNPDPLPELLAPLTPEEEAAIAAALSRRKSSRDKESKLAKQSGAGAAGGAAGAGAGAGGGDAAVTSDGGAAGAAAAGAAGAGVTLGGAGASGGVVSRDSEEVGSDDGDGDEDEDEEDSGAGEEPEAAEAAAGAQVGEGEGLTEGVSSLNLEEGASQEQA